LMHGTELFALIYHDLNRETAEISYVSALKDTYVKEL